MTLGTLLAGITPAAKALGAAIMAADVTQLLKAGILIGSAAYTLYRAHKVYKAKKKVAEETEPDTMASFMAFGEEERTNDDIINDVIRNVRKTTDSKKKKNKKSKTKRPETGYASQLREELKIFKNDLDRHAREFDTTHVWLNNFDM